MKKNQEIGNNMILLTSAFRTQQSFNLVPATADCPYVECMFDPESKILACITKVKKQSYHFLPKLDDNGDALRLKIGKRENGKTVREQRVLVDTFSEFYVTEKEEIVEFLKTFACNESSFNYLQYFEVTVEHPEREREVSHIGNMKVPKGLTATVKKNTKLQIDQT